MTDAAPPYATGFTDLTDEVAGVELPVDGDLPGWLSGALLRNGPARFQGRRRSLRHWFDGQAMLHRFGISDGRVEYTNRLVDTPSSRALTQEGRIAYPEFATDPCYGIFGRLFSRFLRKPTVNPDVNIVHVGDRYAAVTEVPMLVEFDEETLATAGVVRYEDDLAGNLTTAHPHQDPVTGDLVNYLCRFGRHSSYDVYRQPEDSLARTLVGSVQVDQPGYLHSFGITENYAVLAVYPFVVNPLRLLLSGKPFIENYRWRPELGTRFLVVGLRDGELHADCRGDASFAFHHVGAWERDAENLVVDVCVYPDADVVDGLYLDRLRGERALPMPSLVRHHIDLTAGSVRTEVLTDEPVELPTIHYREHNGHPYRYCYGVGASDPSGHDFLDQLVKVDTESRSATVWREEGCYPGEPVFVPSPDASAEDDGVVLSVVLDTRASRSRLLVLDATSYEERARAEVPHHIPFGFHGRFDRYR